MGSGSSHIEPVSADEVLTVQFTHIRKGGYDTQEVDAFLDRVAATMESEAPLLPNGAMSADDVRNVEFSHMKRGGYDTREVDTFLDRVVAVLGSGHVPMGSATPPDPILLEEPEAAPIPLAEAPAPIDEPLASPPPSSGGGGPRLHDPEGAAQRLLAAAQLAADTLTADAESYAARVRREADEYAAATTGEADAHAERVTAAAESQAAAIREVAADEARRVAEEARAELVNEMEGLEARKVELEQLTTSLEGRLATDRTQILAIVEELRATVLATGSGAASVESAGANLEAGLPDTSTVADDVEAAFARPDRGGGADVAAHALVTDEDDDDDDGADETDETDETDDVDAVAAGAASDEIDIDSDADDVADADDADQDRMAVASRSVFDLTDDATDADADDADDMDWLDAGDGPETEEDAGVDADDEPAAATGLFDIEADPEWVEGDDGPPTQAMPALGGEADAGDRFFEDLRQADPDDSLGPLDDDTDAALSAFFDAEEENDTRGRWSDRFGPGR